MFQTIYVAFKTFYININLLLNKLCLKVYDFMNYQDVCWFEKFSATLVALLTFFIAFIATMSMKLVVERSRIMEWMSQVHLPSDPRETRSRSWLRVSSVLEPRVVVSPSWSSDIQSKLLQSGSPPFRYSHLDWPSAVLGVVGITNTVPFSLSVQPGSSFCAMVSSMHVSFQQPVPSSAENSGGPESCLAAFCARLWDMVTEIFLWQASNNSILPLTIQYHSRCT